MKRKYKDYYEMKTVETPGGTRRIPVYIGRYYRCDATEGARRSFAWSVLLLAVLAMAFLIAAGLQNGDFSRTFYITLPYAAQFLPVVFLISASFEFMATKGDLTEPDHRSKFVRIRTMSLTGLIFAGMTITGSVVYTILQKMEIRTDDLLFLFFTIIIGSILGIIHFMQQKMNKCIKINEDNQSNIDDKN